MSYILIKSNVFESLWSGFVISGKIIFCFGEAHGDTIIVEVGPKNGNF